LDPLSKIGVTVIVDSPIASIADVLLLWPLLSMPSFQYGTNNLLYLYHQGCAKKIELLALNDP